MEKIQLSKDLDNSRHKRYMNDIMEDRMKPSKKSRISPSSLATIIILAILGVYFIYFQVTTLPMFYAYTEPEIVYLLSSLSIYKGHPYVMVEHPGTPFQVLGTLLLLFTYPFALLNSESFVVFNLKNPIYYLVIARSTLFIFSSITIYFLAKITAGSEHRTNLLRIITVISSFYAVHPDSFLSITFWTHNSLNFPAGTIALLISWIILSRNKQLQIQEKLIIGFLTGALTSYQLYFITWVIGALVSFGIYEWYSSKSYRKVVCTMLIISLSSIGGFLLMVLPILKRLPNYFSFVFTLVTHSDLYGAGENVITTPERYLGNLFTYSKILAPLFLTVALLMLGLTLVIFIRKWKINMGEKAYTIGLFIQILLLFVIILKHPRRIFFLSIAATVPLLILIFYRVLDNNNFKKKFDLKIIFKTYTLNIKHMVIGSAFIIIIILFATNLNSAIQSHYRQLEWINNQEKSIKDFSIAYSDQLSKAPEDVKILWTYETNSPCSARWYGNHYGDYAFTEELTIICKNNFYISLWSNEVLTTQGWVNPYSYPWDFIVIKDWMVEKNAFPNVISNGIPIDLEESDLTVILPEEKALEYLNK